MSSRIPPWIVALLFLLSSLPLVAQSPCVDCHEQAVRTLADGPHRVVLQDAKLCAACHGDATKHLQSGSADDIIRGATIDSWSGERKARACATCHAKDFPGWRQAAHVEEGLCWECHAAEATHRGESPQRPMKNAAAGECISCHGEVRAQARLHYRHPIDSGQMACESCHDVHGRSAVRREQVADSKCTACHEEQSGPFLFTHGAVENGCSTCHAPHGSPHRGQLRSAGNGICMSCHLQSNFPTVGTASHDFRLSGGGRCWDCHSEVHGSNTTPDLNPRGRR